MVAHEDVVIGEIEYNVACLEDIVRLKASDARWKKENRGFLGRLQKLNKTIQDLQIKFFE
jgi:hypothetical protein